MKRSELEKYRQKLLGIRDRLAREISQMAETVATRSQAVGEHDRTESESVDKEITLERTEEGLQRQVLVALRRMDEGEYGKCEICGATVSKARLEALPYALNCIDCERKLETG